MIEVIIFIIIMLIASFFDIKYKRIPIFLIVALFIVSSISMICDIVLGNVDIITSVAILIPGLTVVGLCLMKFDSIGIGDGFVLTSMGLLMGVSQYVMSLSIAAVITCIEAIIHIAFFKADKDSTLPFVPSLTVGTVLGVILCAK